MPTTISGSNGVTTPTGAVYNSIQAQTAKTATGTSVDFTDIPSWVKRITVMFNGTSTSGTSFKLVQIGAGSITSSGYTSTSANPGTGGVGAITSTAGFVIYSNTAASLGYGHLIITNVSGNIWVASGIQQQDASYMVLTTGGVTLSGTLDRVRITTVNGTDTFDAGSINILYE